MSGTPILSLGAMIMVLAQMPSEAEALGPIGFLLSPPLSTNNIEPVAQKKRQLSASEVCLKIYGLRPIRAYFKDGGKKVICYYDDSMIGSIRDQRRKKK